MHAKPWMVKKPIDCFFFDCDGTLSLIEGINVLADENGVGSKVQAITDRCMGETGLSSDAYQARLDLVQPTYAQTNKLAHLYAQNRAPGAFEVIHALHSLHKKVYVISAGIKNSVRQFAKTLGINTDEVLAVDVFFDDHGRYKGFDTQSNLINAHGKTREINALLDPGQRAVLVGDGISDLEAREAVTRFIGFAGVHGKRKVREQAGFYINSPSFYAILPLSLTKEEVLKLSPQDAIYYAQGVADIDNSIVDIKEK